MRRKLNEYRIFQKGVNRGYTTASVPIVAGIDQDGYMQKEKSSVCSTQNRAFRYMNMRGFIVFISLANLV